MPKVHELIAAQKTIKTAAEEMQKDTVDKFSKGEAFKGFTKALEMIEDTPSNALLQNQSREDKPVVTTVGETLGYAIPFIAKLENLQIQQDDANTKAFADIEIDGLVVLARVPINTLIKWEERLVSQRQIFLHMPTLDATKYWEPDAEMGRNRWRWKNSEHTTKTEKIMVPIELSKATDKHPAQVKESTKESIVGEFITVKRSGELTAVQKADTITRFDKLMIAIKQARQRANDVNVDLNVTAEPIYKYLLGDLV